MSKILVKKTKIINKLKALISDKLIPVDYILNPHLLSYKIPKVLIFRDKNGDELEKDFSEQCFVLKKFAGFTENGIILEHNSVVGPCSNDFESYPIEDLYFIFKWTKNYLIIKEECKEHINNYYNKFKVYPINFEFNDEVFDYETYMSWFTDSELSEISNLKTNL